MKTELKPEELGRRAAASWKVAECPFPEKSPEANEWANGLLAGREAFAWNVSNTIQIGGTCRYLSEAISAELAMNIAKSILIFGADSPCYFRVGWVLKSCEYPQPSMDVMGWLRIARTVNMALQGRELDDIHPADDATWLERLCFLEARDFMEKIIGHPAPSKPGPATFQVDLSVLIPWMGGKCNNRKELIPAPPGV